MIEVSLKDRVRMAARWLSSFLALFLVGTFACGQSEGQGKSVSHASAQPPAHARKASSPKSESPRIPLCPAGGLSPSPPVQGFGKHQVVLSWSASSQSTNPQRSAAGYCLYRSKEQDAAEQTATCSDCEQVTPVAIHGTSCADDQVEDGETYYYIVIGVNEQGVQSSPSNEIEVQIPSGTPIAPSSPQTASCRKPVDAR
jgi:hypothetical protein